MTSSDRASVQSKVVETIRALGRNFDPKVSQATYALYTPLQQRAPKHGVEVHKDLAYGENERQRLDVFAPASKPAKAPIVVYVHGGGYVGGERSPVPGLIYDNVPTFFARHGMIGVNAGTTGPGTGGSTGVRIGSGAGAGGAVSTLST